MIDYCNGILSGFNPPGASDMGVYWKDRQALSGLSNKQVIYP